MSAAHVVNSYLCTSVVPRTMSVVFDSGTRLRVRIRTKLENGVLHNGQQPQSVVNGYIDQGEFEAMKSLSGWDAARSDEHQFRAKIKVSTLAVFELSLLDKWSEQRKKKEE